MTVDDVVEFKKLYEKRYEQSKIFCTRCPFRFSCNDIVIHDTDLSYGDLLSDLPNGSQRRPPEQASIHLYRRNTDEA